MTATIVHAYEEPAGRHYLGLITKRAYRILPGRRAVPAQEQPDLHTAPEYVESTNATDTAWLAHDSDLLAPMKPLTDVLVEGSAHARAATACVETGVQVGGARKAVRVWGDRRMTRGATGELAFSSPEPFTRRSIRWDGAYGGRDVAAESRVLREAMAVLASLGMPLPPDGDVPARLLYPRNHAGRGFFVDTDAERVVGTLAPCLDEVGDPVLPERMMIADHLAWLDCPTSAGYGPVDWLTFPRAAFALPPEAAPPRRSVYEVALGGLLREDLAGHDPMGPVHPRAYNCAPAGLAVCRLEGGERVSLWNLHPRLAHLEFDLPGEQPRLLLEPPGAGMRELAPILQTVLIEPDEDRVTLTWTGSLEVAAPYPDEMVRAMRHACLWS